MRFTEMRLMEWVGGAVAIAGFAMSAQTASAQACDYNYDSTCVQRVDLVVVSGTNNGPGYGQYDPYAGGGSSGGGSGGSANKPSPGESPLPFIRRILKQTKSLCKKNGETCSAWGQRMTSNENVGLLDGSGGMSTSTAIGFCTAVGFAFGVNAQSTCRLGVSEEVALEGCVDVPSCP